MKRHVPTNDAGSSSGAAEDTPEDDAASQGGAGVSKVMMAPRRSSGHGVRDDDGSDTDEQEAKTHIPPGAGGEFSSSSFSQSLFKVGCLLNRS